MRRKTRSALGRRLRLEALATAGAVMFLCAAAAGARADQLGVSVQSATPEQGVPVTLLFSGNAAAIDGSGDGPYLYAIVRPAGGIGCQPSYGSDQAAAGSASTDVFGRFHSLTPGAVSVQSTFAPTNTGGYVVCAWLESVSGDGDSEPAPSSKVTASTSATFSARGPQVSQLTVSLPSHPRPGVAYQIDYTTQTDQQLSLESVVKPAGGLPCASSYELEGQQNQTENDVLGAYTNVFGGPVSTQATDTEQNAGPYLICSWVEGPNQGEVDATGTTPIYVGSPPHPPVYLTPSTELAAFLSWVTSLHPNAHGFWACPQQQILGGQGQCLAEITAGGRWHMLSAAAYISGGHVALKFKHDTAWGRHWSRWSKRIIAGFNLPGRASVNSSAYDWAWLASGAYYLSKHHHKVFRANAYDGQSAGFGRLFEFRCARAHGTITCTNALGDSMRYRPR